MANQTNADLSIIAIPVDGSSLLFDGSSIIPGVHLRWTFTPEMGFPQDGFELFRRRYSQTEFGLERQEWQRIAALGLPHLNRIGGTSSDADKALGVSKALERLQTAITNPRLTVYSRKANELIELLDRLQPGDMYNSTLTKPGGMTAIGIQDILLMASLDPYAARMLGLYYIDPEVAPGEPVDYYVRGKWNGTQWPLKYRRFSNRRCEPIDARPSGCWQLDDVAIHTTRGVAVSFVEGEDHYVLGLSGSAGVYVRFIFPELVEEIQIDIRRTDGNPQWRAVASSYIDEIYADQVYDVAGNPYTTISHTSERVTISAQHGFGIKRLDLYDDAGNSTWEIRGISYRQHSERLKNLDSDVLYVNPPAVTTPVIRRNILVNRPVIAPGILSLQTADKPLSLGDDGIVPLSTTQVELAARVDENRTDIAGPISPVRMHIQRRAQGSSENILLTDSGRQQVLLPRLIAAWNLDGSSRDSRENIPSNRYDGQQFGDRKHLFFNSLNFISGVRTQRQALELYNENAGGKIQGGFVRFSNLVELASLKRYLRLHCWVAPRTDQVFPTLVGNNYRQSFWFGLESTGSNDQFRLRFWINNKVFSSNGTIQAHYNALYWSQVGVEYDGYYVRFSIDGVIDVSHPANLGPVAPNPEKALCLGAEYSATDANDLNGHYPFSGAMANVQIWGDFYQKPQLDLPGLIAIFPFDRTLLDQRNNIPLKIERIGQISSLSQPKPSASLNQPKPSASLNQTKPPASSSGFFRFITELIQLIQNFLRRFFGLSEPKSQARLSLEPDVYKQQHPFAKDAHSLELDGKHFLKVESHPLSSSSFNQFTTQLWINPAAKQSRAVLIDNNTESFKLELVAAKSGYQVQTWFNGQRFLSKSLIPADSWTNLSVSYDGSSVQTYINGELDSDEPASLGPLSVNIKNTLIIGADLISPADEKLAFFAGLISDILFWSSAAETSSPVILRDKSDLREDAELTDYIEHNLLDGQYSYQVQGVDVFGRISTWSDNVNIVARDTVPPPAPVNIGARFLPLRGTLVRSDGDNHVTDISLPITATGTSVGSSGGALVEPDDLLRYDAHFFRAAESASAPPKEQSFEIALAASDAGNLSLQLQEPALPLMLPLVDDRVVIEKDSVVRVRWAWTGMQRLFTPKADTFRIYIAPTPVRMVDGQPEFAETLAAGDWGNAYREIPISLPVSFNSSRTTPLTATRLRRVEDKQRMFEDPDNPILWMPGLQDDEADAKHRVYRIALSDIALPEPLASPDAANYVSAALVAYNHDPLTLGWRAYPVVWYQWNPVDGLTAYIHDEDINKVSPPQLSRVRFYPGVAYSDNVPLRELPVFNIAAQAIPSREYQCTVTAVNTGGYESEKTAVKLVAVNRQRPPPPPRPRVLLGQKDYYGTAPADISWDAGTETVAYLLYRATDSAIYTRDLEQRRQRLGYYRFITPAEIFHDDNDFNDWIVVASNRFGWPELATDWTSLLFVSRPGSIRKNGEMPADPGERAAWLAWDRATPVWRAWTERFYSSRGDEEIIQIAQRGGNETAFGLVSQTPIEATQFTDSINGRVRNRYFYRLRTQSVSGMISSVFGPVSEPAKMQYFDPPRSPVFTGIEAGDRQIRLSWSINREPNVKEYLLYRENHATGIEDLRKWSADSDSRVVAQVPDPLIRTHGRTIRLDGHLPLAIAEDINGVYRLDEFNFEVDDPRVQPDALNYWVTRPTYADGLSLFAPASDAEHWHELRGLRPIADGIPVVCVYRDNSDTNFYVVSQAHTAGYEDNAVQGLTDYYYRLVVVDLQGNRSSGSEIVKAKATDTIPPSPPGWREVQRRLLADGSTRVDLSWTVPDPSARCIIQRRREDQVAWKKASEWMHSPTAVPGSDSEWMFQFIDENTLSHHGYYYRIKIQSGAGNVNNEFNPILVDPAS